MRVRRRDAGGLLPPGCSQHAARARVNYCARATAADLGALLASERAALMADARAQVAHDLEAHGLRLAKLHSYFTAALRTPHITLNSLDGSCAVHTIRQAVLQSPLEVCLPLHCWRRAGMLAPSRPVQAPSSSAPGPAFRMTSRGLSRSKRSPSSMPSRSARLKGPQGVPSTASWRAGGSPHAPSHRARSVCQPALRLPRVPQRERRLGGQQSAHGRSNGLSSTRNDLQTQMQTHRLPRMRRLRKPRLRLARAS